MVGLAALMAYFAFRDATGWLKSMDTDDANAPTVTVAVEGMTCNGCVAKLERTLRADPGVDDVEVTLDPGKAIVKGSIDAARVCALVESAGYKPAAASGVDAG